MTDGRNLPFPTQAIEAFLEAAPDAMIVVDPDGIIALSNRQTEALFGYERNELLGQAIEILVPERFRDAHPALRQAYCDAPVVRPMGQDRELHGRHKRGHDVPVEIALSPYLSEEGCSVLVALRDVSERRRIHRELKEMRDDLEARVRERTEELERVNLELVDDIAARKQAEEALSARLREVEVIGRLGRRALDGLDADAFIHEAVELVAQSLRTPFCLVAEAIPGEDEMSVRAAFGWPETAVGDMTIPLSHDCQAGDSYLSGQRRISSRILEAPYECGPCDHLNLQGLVSALSVPINLAGEKRFGIIAVHSVEARSFTREEANFVSAIANAIGSVVSQARYQRQLLEQESLARLGSMAAIVAHEVKNPLGGISGAVQIVRRKMAPESRDYDILTKVLDRIVTLNETLEDLLAYARPRKPDLRPTSILICVESALEIFRQDPAHEAVEVSLQREDSQVVGDSQHLGLVLTNLLNNAAQAMDGKGRVHLSIEEHGNWCRLSIADEGPGIPEDARSQVFEPFFTTKVQGSGLGLATVNRILQQHGGSISVDEAPGGGACFTLLLPRAGVEGEDSPR